MDLIIPFIIQMEHFIKITSNLLVLRSVYKVIKL